MQRNSGVLWSALALACAMVTGVNPAQADTAAAKPSVQFSWDGRFFIDDLPHGKRFLIHIRVPPGQTFKQAIMWPAGDRTCDKSPERSRRLPFENPTVKSGATPPSASEQKAASGAEPGKSERVVIIDVPPLKYSTAYCFRFSAVEGLSAEKIAAIGAAVRQLVTDISARGLYDVKSRRQYVQKQLGPLSQQTLLIAGNGLQTVLDWVMQWTQNDRTFVAMWAAYGDLEHSQELVSKRAQALRVLDLGDVGALGTAAAHPSVARATAMAGKLRTQIETGSFHRSGTGHVSAATPPALERAAAALQATARSTRTEAELAHQALCSSRPKARKMDDVSVAIDRLQRQISDAREQLLGLDASKPAARTTRERLQELERQLVARRTDRLCLNLVNLKFYSRRLDSALRDELQHATAIAGLQRTADEVITAKSKAIPIEVVHGARSANPTYTERATAYISADVGAVFPRFSSGNYGASLFVGINFNFGPVDKDVSLSEDGGWRKRLSLVAGLTVTEFRDNANTVTGIAGGRGALLGAGFRVSDYLRLGAGAVLFRQRNPNPAIDSQELRFAPYLSMSVDADVAGLVKDLFNKGKNAI